MKGRKGMKEVEVQDIKALGKEGKMDEVKEGRREGGRKGGKGRD